MDIILKNENTNSEKYVKSGIGAYLFWELLPVIGFIIVLIISIQRKQFKVWFFNNLLWVIISSIILGIVYIIGIIFIGSSVVSGSGTLLFIGSIFIAIAFVVGFAFAIVLYVYMIRQINQVTLKDYLDSGYEIKNENIVDKNYIEKVKISKKPWWVLVK